MSLVVPESFFRVSIKALISDESGTKYLLFQEKNGKWDFPWGGLNFWESISDGLKRELAEEPGLQCVDFASHSQVIIPWERKEGIWCLHLFYEVKILNYDFVPSKECQALGFFTPEEMKSLVWSWVLSLFAKYFNENH